MDHRWRSADCIQRHPSNPILSGAQCPFPAGLVFNCGVARFEGRYVMLFRNDYGDMDAKRLDGTNLGLAWSTDGVRWTVEPKPVWELSTEEIGRVYDPRITILEGRPYVCFAIDTRHGVRGGIARTDDFHRFEIVHSTAPDNRNLVLFPEKIGGRYVRLERPMPVYSRGKDRFDLWASSSPDLEHWGTPSLVLGVEHVPYANDKVGPGAPPIRTEKGWLVLFHAVDRDDSRGVVGWHEWPKRYHAGVMLLDLSDPRRVIGMCKTPLLTPETPEELEHGFRPNTVFPTGAILEPDGEVRIYYGAADTVVNLAFAHVDELLALCTEPR